MWKCVVRGIRETLERRGVCRTNIYSQSSQDNSKNDVKTSLTCRQKFLPPIFVSCDNGFCGSAKSAGTKKDKKHNSEWNTRYNWSEAFSWSSALAAGWVVCQTLCLHKRIFDKNNKENLKPKCGISFLTQKLNLQPRNILPVTNCVGNEDNKSSLQNSDLWNVGKPFDPVSEKAFEEVGNEFTKVHDAIVGEYEFRSGIHALKEKRYKDALMHFSEGAKLSSPGSMFNLGLCYELGIGTSVDQKKAAKYYNDAATHDHADALYNLGVFHAQGRGGLSVNIDAARIYFTRAAKLGQKQAQHALDLEKAKTSSKKTTISVVPHIDTMLLRLVNSTLSTKFLANYTLSTRFRTTSKQDPCTIKTPEYNENTIQDPTQMFLDLLGLGKPSKSPITITTNCKVPC